MAFCVTTVNLAGCDQSEAGKPAIVQYAPPACRISSGICMDSYGKWKRVSGPNTFNLRTSVVVSQKKRPGFGMYSIVVGDGVEASAKKDSARREKRGTRRSGGVEWEPAPPTTTKTSFLPSFPTVLLFFFSRLAQ